MARFDPKNYVSVYEMAKSGAKKGHIMKSLKISKQRWNKDVAIQDAYKRGRTSKAGSAYSHFKDFALHRLPAEAAETWRMIDEAGRLSRRGARGDEEAVPQAQGIYRRAWAAVEASPARIQQHLFLYALVHCNFVVTSACRACGVPPTTVKRWAATDPEFHRLLEGVDEVKKDFFEECLIELCRSGDTTAIVFANRTKNKDRGYGDKTTVDVNVNSKSEVKVTLDEMPLEVRLAMLEAARNKERLMLEDKSQIMDAEFEEKP